MKQLFKNITAAARSFYEGFLLFLKNLLLFLRHGFRQIISFSLFCLTLSFLTTETMNYLLAKAFSAFSRFPFLNEGNMHEFMSEPVTWLLILIYLIFASFLSLFEIAGLIHAYSLIQVGREVPIAGMFEAGWRTCRKTLLPKNWLVILFLFVLIPFTGNVTLSGSGMKLTIPYFIMEGIEANTVYRNSYTLFYIILVAVELTYLFSIHIYVLRDVSYLRACQESRELMKGNYISTILYMTFLTLGLNFILNSLSASIPANITEVISLFQRRVSIAQRSYTVGVYVYVLRTILKGLIAPAVTIAGMTVLFFNYVEARNLLGKLGHRAFTVTWNNPTYLRAGNAVIIVLFLAITVFMSIHYRYLLEPVDIPMVCAHRGDNTYAPENTVESMELALNEYIDWVEVDVHEAKDGIIVCSHDENLLRCTGHNVRIPDKTFQELQAYEMLPSLPGRYDHVRVPSLEAVIRTVKEHDGYLQIDLKANGSEKHLEEEVVRLIHEYDMKDHVIVISLKAYLLENIKKIDPTIRTAVCAFAAWDSYQDYPAGDYLSLNDSAVTPELVRTMHEAGKLVFCWTVDSEDVVQYLVSCDVDIIGTNDPLLITAAIENADFRGGGRRIFHILMNRFAEMSR